MDTASSTSIAIFASGTGSNAAKIIEHFNTVDDIEVSLIVSNRKQAGVLDLARAADIPTEVISRRAFYETDELLFVLAKYDVEYVILAGFLWLVPPYLIKRFEGKMLNIHPALLPKYGGKGMYGKYVHQAVKAAGDRESGISIHQVNQAFDEGAVIFQAKCQIEESDTPEIIARKVLALEHLHFATVIEGFIRETQKSLEGVREV